MSDLGRLLYEAREARRLSLADIESAIRVRQKYLIALEDGNYAALPPAAIARGFLRNYARFLGLEPEEVLELYMAETGQSSAPLALSPIAPVRQVDYRPLEAELMTAPASGWWRWVVALMVVAGLVAGVWWVLNQGIDWTNMLRDLGPQRGAAAVSSPTPSRSAQVTTSPPAARGAGPTATLPVAPTEESTPPATSASGVLRLPIPTAQPTITPTATPAPTSTPEPPQRIILTVTASQRAWVRVSVDGAVAYEGTFEPAQSRTWEAAQWISLRSGNAGGVSLVLNDNDLGVPGASGQVIAKNWVLGADGRIEEAVAAPNNPNMLVTVTPSR